MAQYWDDETDAQADEFFSTLSVREIRRRQSLCSQQLVIAHERGLTDALEDLRRMELALQRSMLKRLHPVRGHQPEGRNHL